MLLPGDPVVEGGVFKHRFWSQQELGLNPLSAVYGLCGLQQSACTSLSLLLSLQASLTCPHLAVNTGFSMQTRSFCCPANPPMATKYTHEAYTVWPFPPLETSHELVHPATLASFRSCNPHTLPSLRAPRICCSAWNALSPGLPKRAPLHSLGLG